MSRSSPSLRKEPEGVYNQAPKDEERHRRSKPLTTRIPGILEDH